MAANSMNFFFVSGGQFTPAKGGQFEPAKHGLFKSAWGGQYHRRLQITTGTVLNDIQINKAESNFCLIYVNYLLYEISSINSCI